MLNVVSNELIINVREINIDDVRELKLALEKTTKSL